MSRCHQRFSNEKTAEAKHIEATQLFRILQSALTDHDFVILSFGDETLACFQRNLKRLKIAVVYADDLCASIQRTAHLGGRMHFNERVESKLVFRNFAQIT